MTSPSASDQRGPSRRRATPRAETRRSGTRHARRRRTLAIGAALLLVAGVGGGVLALSGGDDDGAPSASVAPASAEPSTTRAATSTTPGATRTTTAPAPAPSTTVAAPDVTRRYAVGTRTVTLVDGSRTTSPNGSFGGAASRTIPTDVWYPATGAAGGEPTADAPPDSGRGPYPLVLFAHGYAVTPDFYAPLLERWAAAGYVVAAPVFPILSGSDGGASHVDYEKTFGDASFVMTQVLALKGDPLSGLTDPNRVGAAGHSDGEVVSFGVGFLACCRDARVKSVIAMAGDLANTNNAHVRDTGTPILHIMETRDEFDPYDHSIAWDRENLTSPRWMVSLYSSHVPPYTRPGDPAFELTSSITIAFLDGTLKGTADRLDAVTSEVNAHADVGTVER
jgi:dienelactone hydrolase